MFETAVIGPKLGLWQAKDEALGESSANKKVKIGDWDLRPSVRRLYPNPSAPQVVENLPASRLGERPLESASFIRGFMLRLRALLLLPNESHR